MQFPTIPAMLAPLATGHPYGLPADQRGTSLDKRVQPIGPSQDSNTTSTRGEPQPFLRASHGRVPAQTPQEDHVAPPSIMQIKILQMLDEQASKIDEDADNPDEDKPEADPTKPEPTATHPEAAATGAREGAVTDQTRTSAADSKPSLPGYEDAARLSRKAVFSTLP